MPQFQPHFKKKIWFHRLSLGIGIVGHWGASTFKWTTLESCIGLSESESNFILALNHVEEIIINFLKTR